MKQTVKTVFAVLLFLLISFGSKAQSLTFSAGPTFYKIKYLTFGYFADSYNRYYKGELSKEMNKINFGYGKYAGFAYVGERFALEFNYNNYLSKASADFISGGSRHFNAHTGYGQMLFNVGISSESTCFFFIFGIGAGRLNIDSWYEDNDGTVNYGFDQVLNGNYRSFYSATIFGVRGSFPVADHMSVQLRFERVITPYGYGSHHLVDTDDGKYDANSGTNAIPSDYMHYKEIMETHNWLPIQYAVQPDIRGYTFTVAFKYDFYE